MTSAPDEALPETPLLSATQINLWNECPRKWAWRYIAKIKTPQGIGAALGTELDDTQLQPYLRDGRPFDYTRQSGYIAAAGLAYLPQPKAPGLEVQRRFVIPSPSGPFAFQGFLDLWLPDGRHMPQCSGDVPAVGDFKSTSDLKWAKTPKDLETDTQAQLYATWAIVETGAPAVDLVWIYFQTKKAKKVRRVHLRVTQDHVAQQFEAIDRIANSLHETKAALEGLAPDAAPLSLPPNPSQCNAYGGCPYRDRCNLSPAEFVETWAPSAREEEADMSTAAALFARLAQKAGPASPPAASPPPAPEEAPAALMTPYVPKSPAGAVAVGLPPSAAAPLGINPPESALPPPPAEAPKKRGRPSGSKNAPKAEGPPAEEDAIVSTTVTVTWGEENYSPVAYNGFRVGPFTMTTAVREGETTAQAILRAHAELNEAAKTLRGSKAVAFKAAIDEMGVTR